MKPDGGSLSDYLGDEAVSIIQNTLLAVAIRGKGA